MHGNNPTRDSIENAFAAAAAQGQIKAWERLPGYGPHAKWRVTLNSGAVGPQGGSDMEIRTYQEGKLVAAALASAHFVPPHPAEEFRCSRCHHVHDEEFMCELDCVTCAIADHAKQEKEDTEDDDATPEACEI